MLRVRQVYSRTAGGASLFSPTAPLTDALPSVHRDTQALLTALPNVGVFDPSFRGPGAPAASTGHQPPARGPGALPGHWLPQPSRFPLLPGLPQSPPLPAQRSSAETGELRAALLKIFPDSEQRLKIDQILAAHPYMKDLNALSALVLD